MSQKMNTCIGKYVTACCGTRIRCICNLLSSLWHSTASVLYVLHTCSCWLLLYDAFVLYVWNSCIHAYVCSTMLKAHVWHGGMEDVPVVHALAIICHVSSWLWDEPCTSVITCECHSLTNASMPGPQVCVCVQPSNCWNLISSNIWLIDNNYPSCTSPLDPHWKAALGHKSMHTENCCSHIRFLIVLLQRSTFGREYCIVCHSFHGLVCLVLAISNHETVTDESYDL